MIYEWVTTIIRQVSVAWKQIHNFMHQSRRNVLLFFFIIKMSNHFSFVLRSKTFHSFAQEKTFNVCWEQTPEANIFDKIIVYSSGPKVTLTHSLHTFSSLMSKKPIFPIFNFLASCYRHIVFDLQNQFLVLFRKNFCAFIFLWSITNNEMLIYLEVNGRL